MRSLLGGRKTQARLLGGSPLRDCAAGDRLWVREACAGGDLAADGVQEISAAVRRASFVVFLDGWRQYRDGRGKAGPIPTNRNLTWTPAILMPRWASRATLVVEAVRVAKLQDIGGDDIAAEGQVRRFAGLYWRWRSPVRGFWRDPRPAFAALWDATHGTGGERWADNPDVVIMHFRHEQVSGG